MFHLSYNATNPANAVDHFFPYVAWTTSYHVVEDKVVYKVERRSTIITVYFKKSTFCVCYYKLNLVICKMIIIIKLYIP